MKRAFITGITGQDGAYLTALLLQKGYEVHGLKRRTSLFNTDRIDEFLSRADNRLHLHHGDMGDSSSLIRILGNVRPDEIYNLAAQSHVGVSFEIPEYTANSDALGTLRLLEAVRLLGLEKSTRFYQASTSELYGNAESASQNEDTPFRPRSPYASAKLYAYWITINYREAYGMHASNGILFNHESPLRGETFVTRKITRAAARIALGMQKKLLIGNLDSKRDWGHAKDYAEMQWRIVQQETADDYVIATGEQHSIREFVAQAFSELGIIIRWEGEGAKEKGIVDTTGGTHAAELTAVHKGQEIIAVHPRYYRPTEVHSLLGDASKARAVLSWSPSVTFKQIIAEMVQADYDLARQEQNYGGHSLKVPNCF